MFDFDQVNAFQWLPQWPCFTMRYPSKSSSQINLSLAPISSQNLTTLLSLCVLAISQTQIDTFQPSDDLSVIAIQLGQNPGPDFPVHETKSLRGTIRLEIELEAPLRFGPPMTRGTTGFWQSFGSGMQTPR